MSSDIIESPMIVRNVNVSVNHSRTPREVIRALRYHRSYAIDSVVDAMPMGKGDRIKIYLFKPNPSAYHKTHQWMTDDDLEREYKSQKLNALDPYSLATLNDNEPSFCENHPNGTHWKGSGGKWYYATFDSWGGGPVVNIRQSDNIWLPSWWFAGYK